MICSMTGFGHCEKDIETGRIRVEIRSVNHRFFDLNLRMHHRLNGYEQKIRSLLKQSIIRGKVDVSIRFDAIGDADATLVYNETLATEYYEKFQQIASSFQLPVDMTATRLGLCHDVLTLQEASFDADALWLQVEDALKIALAEFKEAREQEGEHLKKDVLDKLEALLSYVLQIETRSPQIIEEYKQKLMTKIQDLLTHTQVDENRIATEIVLFADKICVDEEIVRLKSHIQSAITTLEKKDEVGRKMDFIAQEMNREANTILSKSNDIVVSDIGIEMKTLIEKIREQIQNLE